MRQTDWRSNAAPAPADMGNAVLSLPKKNTMKGQQMKYVKHWQDDAGLRGAASLKSLPDAERQEWEQLWSDVAALLGRARG
jgi:hypothetical protein